jgi:hypothetical protein
MKAAPSLRDRLRAQLADLKMPGALEALDDILAGLDGGSLKPPAAIEALLGAQIALRNNRRLQAAMRSSRLPVVKTLTDFDFSFQPSVKREQIESLHTLGFIERRENVVFLGPPASARRTSRSHSPSPRPRVGGASTTAPWAISSRRSRRRSRLAGSRSG